MTNLRKIPSGLWDLNLLFSEEPGESDNVGVDVLVAYRTVVRHIGRWGRKEKLERMTVVVVVMVVVVVVVVCRSELGIVGRKDGEQQRRGFIRRSTSAESGNVQERLRSLYVKLSHLAQYE